MSPDIRPYDRDRDLTAIDRIWREVGWLDTDDAIETLDRILEVSHVEVGMIDGSAECAVTWAPGSIHYQNTDLPLCAVTAVTTSLIARKQGFATTMTARALSQGAADGAAVAALGMFEQGFYDRVGFGSGTYEHMVQFDPTALALDHITYRRPQRLTVEDHGEMYEAMRRRNRSHGTVVLDPPEILHSECEWISNAFGLGYRDEGRLTHFVFGRKSGEHGPFRVSFIGYEEPSQLLELLRLLAELGDQVDTIRMIEPADVQLQDLLREPIGTSRRTEGAGQSTGIRSEAWMQLRVLDLAACVEARCWPGPPVRFNLSLSDPAPGIADDGWEGVGGDYVVCIGDKSTLDQGADPDLDRIDASVNAFSRLWFGVRPASSLALTDQLAAPASLLGRLDECLSLPAPRPGWDF